MFFVDALVVSDFATSLAENAIAAYMQTMTASMNSIEKQEFRRSLLHTLTGHAMARVSHTCMSTHAISLWTATATCFG